MVLIYGALRGELHDINAKLEGRTEVRLADGRYLRGTLARHEVALVWGVGRSGIGRLEEVMARSRPQLCCIIGIAGGLTLPKGTLFVGSEVVMESEAQSAPDDMRWRAGAKSKEIADALGTIYGGHAPPHAASVSEGRLLTVDIPVIDAARRDRLSCLYRAQAVDMETAHVARRAHDAMVPWYVIRWISDHADAPFEREQARASVAQASPKLMAAVKIVLKISHDIG